MNPQTRSFLERLTQRASRSLLQYVGDSFPWTTVRAQGSMAELQQIVHEDRDSLNALLRFLGKCRITVPSLGAFPAWFTTINFVSLRHLQPLLIEEQRQAIAYLEQGLAELSEESVRHQLQEMLTLKQRHLQQLEAAGPTEERLALAAG